MHFSMILEVSKLRLIVLALALVLGLLVGRVARAANWVEVSTNVKGNTLYVDVDNILAGHIGEVSYREKIVYNLSNVNADVISVKGEPAWYGVFLRRVNCDTKIMFKPHEVKLYGIYHRLLFSHNSDTPEYFKVIPNTLSDAAYSFVCAYWTEMQARTMQ